MDLKNLPLLQHLQVFVVATKSNRNHFDLDPFGLKIAPSALFDPLRSSSAPFLDLLSTLDTATFGPVGMPMPKWVFFDCSELPGGVIGLAAPVGAVEADLLSVLQIRPSYTGLVPLSMYIAIPTLEAGTWVGHNLASINAQRRRGQFKGLGSLTKAIALKVFRAQYQLGVTQWSSDALRVHTRMGSLEILTAWTPAHSFPETLTYRSRVTDPSLLHLAGASGSRIPSVPPEQWIDSTDHKAMGLLQCQIENGHRFQIVGPPRTTDRGQQVPIARI